LSVVYDLPVITSTSDPLVQKINRFAEIAGKAAIPGAHLVEFFPWMMHIPPFMAKWRRDAEAAFEEYSALFGGLFHAVENRIVNTLPLSRILQPLSGSLTVD
jgi:hypothetical protein